MLEAHGVPMKSEQQAMGVTMGLRPGQHHVLIHHHRHLCRQLLHQPGGSAVPQRQELLVHGDNRIGKPPLKSFKDMEKKAVPHGMHDYITSDDGILALRWKDNKVVTLLSTDLGVEPISSVYHYCSDTRGRNR